MLTDNLPLNRFAEHERVPVSLPLKGQVVTHLTDYLKSSTELGVVHIMFRSTGATPTSHQLLHSPFVMGFTQ